MSSKLYDCGKSLDQILYEAYCECTGWKSAVTGAPLPPYYECPTAVQAGWQAAMDAAIDWMCEKEEKDATDIESK